MTVTAWEHATITMPPDWGAMASFLDMASHEFGAELLALLPVVEGLGKALAVSGQPPVRLVWTLLLRVPAGNRGPLLALARGEALPHDRNGETP